MESQKLGWIGLGHMGSRIATRLRNAGSTIMVYDHDRAKADELVSQGAELGTSLAALAAHADVIFSSVPDAAAVRSVYFGTYGVLYNAKPGARIVEMSTVAPETALHLFRADRERARSPGKADHGEAERLYASVSGAPHAEGFSSHSFEGRRTRRPNACNGGSRGK